MESELLMDDQGPDFWEALIRGLSTEKESDYVPLWVTPFLIAFVIVVLYFLGAT